MGCHREAGELCPALVFGSCCQFNPPDTGGKNVVANHPQIPDEVRYKTGYVNPVPAPAGFSSVLLWGIAIADTRTPGYESAQVEVASTRLTCQVDGREVVLNDDGGQVRGGLYRRLPWFGTDAHDPIPLAYDPETHSVVLHVGQRADRVWHFWSPSPRAALPPGKLEGGDGSSPGQDFSRRPASDGHGLLAFSDDSVRCGRE